MFETMENVACGGAGTGRPQSKLAKRASCALLAVAVAAISAAAHGAAEASTPDASDLAAALRPVPATAKMSEDGYFIWCGALAKDDKGLYHLFYSRWKKSLGFGSWMTSSEIAHATGPSPFGPWTHKDVALPLRGLEYWDGPCTHNPTICRFDGKWYLYYTATTGDGVPAGNGYNWLHRNNQRIGVAVADSLDGPWTRFDKPLIDVSADAAAPDALNVSNPAVARRPDGTYIMVYKAVGKKRRLPRGGPVVHLVATSKSPTGPFVKNLKPQFTAGKAVFPAEDPFIWFEDGRFRAIVKDFGGHFTRRKGPTLVLFESPDGLDWTLEKRPFVADCTINWADGRTERVNRLERPQLYFEDGRPVALLAAAGCAGLKDSFNVQIPIDLTAQDKGGSRPLGSADDNIPKETRGEMPPDAEMEKMEKRVPPAVWDAWRKAHPAPFWLFGEDRAFAVRNNIVPAHWFAAGSSAAECFHGAAHPGEFYPFQVCAVSEKPRRIRWKAETPLAVSRITPEECEVAAGGAKPIWILVEIPKDAAGRTLKGAVRVADAASGESASLPFEIEVKGEILEDGGVSDAWRLSRLKWLDSDAGREDTVVKPYAPVAVDSASRTIRILGRDITLGEDGLPAQIVSHFSGSNTRIEEKGFPLLARPVAFSGGGDPKSSTFAFTETTPTHAAWRSETRLDGGAKRIVEGRLDFAGAASFRIRHEGGRVAAASLEIAMPADAARYVEGLGRNGGAFSGGRIEHRWNPALNRDAIWMGRVNGGLAARFGGANRRRPLVNAYYAWRPLAMPEGWASGGGKIVAEKGTDVATIRAAGADAPDGAEWNFDLFITPFHALDMGTHLRDRYFHAKQRTSSLDAAKIAASGATVVNLHHNTVWNPYINYPFNGDGGPLLKKAVADAHGAGLLLKIYYTTRELTQNLPEFFALKSLDGEVALRRDSATPGWPCTNRMGPHPWLAAHAGDDILPAWRETVRFPAFYPPRLDLAVITAPETRWDNFYLAGLDHLVREYGIDGLYIDDTALTGESMLRARRILDRDGKRRLIDNHSWNHHDARAGGGSSNLVFIELYPFFDSLWRGEGFSDAAPADFWLVERSGFPFGVPSEMLGKGSPFKGLVFGMTARWGWGGNPRGLGRFFDETGLDRMAFHGWWDDESPVRTSGADDVKASVWTGNGKMVLAVANFAKAPRKASFAFDAAKGFDGAKARWRRPAIADVQESALPPDFSGELEIPAGGGFVAVAETENAPARRP